MTPIPLIAPLFVPATRPDRFAKAAASGADAVIIDLEDAVPPDAKDLARSNLREALKLGVPTFVRINAAATPWYSADVGALALLGIRQVCLPKVEDDAVLDDIVARLGGVPEILAQIETARGVEGAATIARHPAVAQLAFGPADFFLDMGLATSPRLTQHVLCHLSVTSRASGKALPLDGPAFSVGDPGVLDAECRDAFACGAGGKLCIHTTQPGRVRMHFEPSEKDYAWAERVIGADRDGAAQMVDGRMIDAPIVARARTILSRRQKMEPP